MAITAYDNFVQLVLSKGDEAGPVRYEAARYADLIDTIGQQALERIEFRIAVFYDGRWMFDGPHRFISGRLGYDCRKDRDFGYLHTSHEKMFGWVVSAAGLPEGQASLVPLQSETYERYNSQEDLEDIQHELQRRGIRQLLHFTDVGNIPSIIEHGLMSVEQCALKGIKPSINDSRRHDRRLNGISLSISRTNKALLYAFRQRHPGREYAVLSIDPVVIQGRPTAFFRFNAASGQSQAFHDADLADANALRSALVKDRTQRQDMPDNEQSEIMVFGDIPHHLIKGIHFETSESLERSRSLIHSTPMLVSPRYFKK